MVLLFFYLKSLFSHLRFFKATLCVQWNQYGTCIWNVYHMCILCQYLTTFTKGSYSIALAYVYLIF